MRDAFFRTLERLAVDDDRIELVVGDLGFGVVDAFAARFPDRFTNAGVAEQNMTGLAAGLALTGSKVFTYSIANFPTLRCLEQIRNDVCYHKADVTVVSVGAGFAYGALGMSHHALEDIAILRSIPELMVASPGDPLETEAVTTQLVAHGGPAYLRLGRAGEVVVHNGVPELPPGASLEVVSGDEIAIFVTGSLLPIAIESAETLAAEGTSTRVISVPWIVPLDEMAIRAAGDVCRLVVTLEEHSVVGGLGGAVAEVLAERPRRASLLRIGVPRRFVSTVGSQDYLRSLHGLDCDGVVRRINEAAGSAA